MTTDTLQEAKLVRRFSPPPALCSVPVGAAGGGAPGIADESLLMAVAVASFVGAAVWMFRRFGQPKVKHARTGIPDLRPEPPPTPA